MTPNTESQLPVFSEIDFNGENEEEKPQSMTDWLKDKQDALIFDNYLNFKKKFTNEELMLYQYFYEKTHENPTLIICLGDFIFFFVEPSIYLKCRGYIKTLRREINLKKKKIQILSHEKLLAKLLFALFPDVNIHDITARINEKEKTLEINLCLLNYGERGIAIGTNGCYIKTVNKLLNSYIQNNSFPLKIKCVYVSDM